MGRHFLWIEINDDALVESSRTGDPELLQNWNVGIHVYNICTHCKSFLFMQTLEKNTVPLQALSDLVHYPPINLEYRCIVKLVKLKNLYKNSSDVWRVQCIIVHVLLSISWHFHSLHSLDILSCVTTLCSWISLQLSCGARIMQWLKWEWVWVWLHVACVYTNCICELYMCKRANRYCCEHTQPSSFNACIYHYCCTALPIILFSLIGGIMVWILLSIPQTLEKLTKSI